MRPLLRPQEGVRPGSAPGRRLRSENHRPAQRFWRLIGSPHEIAYSTNRKSAPNRRFLSLPTNRAAYDATAGPLTIISRWYCDLGRTTA